MSHVGYVHDALYVKPRVAQVLFEDILHYVGAQVADVREMVHGRATSIHFYSPFFYRFKLFFFSCERVI